MSLPSQSVFVDDLSADFALWDVSQALPQKGTWPTRPLEDVKHLYVHKSGADGPAGFRGVKAMANYCVNHRDWKAAPYHVWLSAEPDEDGTTRMVVYRCLPWEARSYHTGGDANQHGIGIAIQGNYDSEWDGISTIKPTAAQQGALYAITEYLSELLNLDLTGIGPLGRTLSGHWEAPKPKRVCPGDWARSWVLARREDTEPPTPAISGPIWPTNRCPTALELQRVLALLGFDPGPLDGIRGYRTRGALESFQAAHGLEPDGWYGPRTAAAISTALTSR